ncbi:MAG: molybdenum ABC transporter ATP-binding protein [Sterolibacterium sp.]
MTIEACFRHGYPGFTLDVDLSLPERGVTALFGHSGAGKTTLLRLIAGLEQAANGKLTVNGEVWQNNSDVLPPHRRSLGYVFQEASLFSHLSVRDNLVYGMKRVPVRLRRVALERAIELLGIAGFLQRMPDSLSGGERQRVAIARALVTSPRLLLMDEPLAALDLARKTEILPYLERLFEELEMPVLYVSHSPDEVARLADYLVVMDAGRAVATGALSETLARLDLPIRLGEDVGVVLQGSVAEKDQQWHLARIRCSDGDFWVRDAGHPIGHGVRVRILARDISIALHRTDDSSIVNILPVEVVEVADDTHPAQVLVKLRLATSCLLARVTRRSAASLNLIPGRRVFAQIKAVALIA